ncbi:MAG TPA: hypothetical protein VI248_01315 [Kineosporiaceae bacterium]
MSFLIDVATFPSAPLAGTRVDTRRRRRALPAGAAVRRRDALGRPGGTALPPARSDTRIQ